MALFSHCTVGKSERVRLHNWRNCNLTFGSNFTEQALPKLASVRATHLNFLMLSLPTCKPEKHRRRALLKGLL